MLPVCPLQCTLGKFVWNSSEVKLPSCNHVNGLNSLVVCKYECVRESMSECGECSFKGQLVRI